MPETVVLKKDEPEGTSVDSQTQSYNEWELLSTNGHNLCKPLQNNVSQLATQQAVSTKYLLNEQHQVLEESQNIKDREIAKEFGLSTEELKKQKEALEKLTQEQNISDRNRQYQNSTTQQGEQLSLPSISVFDRSDDSSDYRRKSNEDTLQRCDVTNMNREGLKRQQSEGQPPQLPRKSQPVHSFSVGSLVEVSFGEKNLCGTIKWVGTFPDVKELLAGVELVSYAL